MQTKKPAVLILATDAEEYLPYLQELTADGVELTVAASGQTARDAYAGHTVVLGQPDLVALVLLEMPKICWVQSSWAGVTPILNTGRTDYLLTGVKNTFGPDMAEYVLGYLLARELKIFERLDRQANRSWWDEHSGTLRDKSIGIMGTGSIGSYFARLLRPFAAHISGFSRGGTPVEGFDRVYAADQLDRFLAEPDYVVCVLPDTPGTRNLLDAQAFRTMKNHCCLINVGRGATVDEQALVNALQAGELAGAVLDVFRLEPLPQGSPLWDAPGLIVTGHISGGSMPKDIAAIFMENYRRYCAGEPLEYLIDFERGY
jgi:phosphoglycerate dehydrogenase-like enzyme